MISFLSGNLKEFIDGKALVDVNGVGYLVNWVGEGSLGSQVEMYVYTQWRESDVSLWGFSHLVEWELFQKLIQVDGVGTRTAFLLLARLGTETLCAAIAGEDVNTLRVPGVGEKTAKKLILELKNKLPQIASPSNPVLISNQIQQQVAEALQGLGYSAAEIKLRLETLPKEETDVARLLKLALSKKS